MLLNKALSEEQQNPLLCFICKRAVISWSCLYATPFTPKLPMPSSPFSRTQKNSCSQKRKTTHFKWSVLRHREWEWEEEGEEQSILLFIFHRWAQAWPDMDRDMIFSVLCITQERFPSRRKKKSTHSSSLQGHHAEVLLQLPGSVSSGVKCKQGLPPTWPGKEPNAFTYSCSF